MPVLPGAQFGDQMRGMTVITCDFTSRGNTPLYEHLYRSIRADIESGRLKADQRLPSKRSLAQQLRIGVVTVENAYAQLLSEGYIRSAERSGYFVNRLEQGFASRAQARSGGDFQRQRDDTGAKAMPAKSGGEWFLDLKTNSTQPDKFPFSTWAKLMREVLSERHTRLLEASPRNGAYELRAEIARHLYQFRGMTVSPEQVVVGAGTEYLYGLIVQLLGRGRVFAVEEPGYRKIWDIYSKNGVSLRHIVLDSHGMSAEMLAESGADVAHISPSHQFPMGIVMPIKRRQEILKWAGEAEGRFIIEDDYDSEFRLSSRPIPAMQSIDTAERVIYVNTFTKSLAPSIRIGYMVLPPGLMERYERELGFYACTVPSFEQYTLAKFMASGCFERHINRMRNTYKALRDLLIDELKKSPLWGRCTVYEENAGLHFLLRVKSDKTEEELVHAAADAGIRISCLSEYCAKKGPERDPTLVVNYSGVDRDRIPEGIARLAKALS